MPGAWRGEGGHNLRLRSRKAAETIGQTFGRGHFGFDESRNHYIDLAEPAIIEPTKVVRAALENAVSVARVLLLTKATMADLPEPKPEGSTMPDMEM
jgi:chaperonin GroEL